MQVNRKKPPLINQTLLELLVGIAIYGVFGVILIILFIPDKAFSIAGFAIGDITSAAMIIHMSVELEKSLYMGEEGALKHTRKTTGLRMIVVAAVLIAVAWFRLGDIISSLVGIMALKVSAYIQPFTHKVFNKFKEGRR